MKTQFTLEDIKDKVKLRKDIEDTYQRLKNSKTRRKNRTDEDIYKRTYIGLPLEHYEPHIDFDLLLARAGYPIANHASKQHARV